MNVWLKEYNELRPHSGKHCFGKTPMQTFLESAPEAKSKQLNKRQEESLKSNEAGHFGVATAATQIAGIAPAEELQKICY